jgi:hypothetical protein
MCSITWNFTLAQLTTFIVFSMEFCSLVELEGLKSRIWTFSTINELSLEEPQHSNIQKEILSRQTTKEGRKEALF